MSTLNARIRTARAGLGMSQQELATGAGLHANTVTAVENGAMMDTGTLLLCQSVLEARGVEFLEIAGRLGVILPRTVPDPGAATIRAARALLLLTRNDLAARAGINFRTLAKIESADPAVRTAGIRACLKVIGRLGVDLFELDGRQVVMLPPAHQLEAFLASARAPAVTSPKQ